MCTFYYEVHAVLVVVLKLYLNFEKSNSTLKLSKKYSALFMTLSNYKFTIHQYNSLFYLLRIVHI